MGNELTLADAILSANTGLDAIKRAPIVEENTGRKCIRIQDVNQSKQFSDWGNTLVEDKNYIKFQLQENDILIARTGGSVGANKYISQEFPAVYNNGLIRIRINQAKHNSKFIYYLLQTDAFKSHIDAIAFSTSAQPNMKIKDFLRFEFSELGLKAENEIENILSSLDNKIQLNRETNQTLEAMAQALFKSWFVDFDPVFDNIIAHNLTHNKEPLHNIPEPLLPHAQRRLNVHNVGRGSARQTAAHAFHHLFPQAFEQSDEPSVGIQGWVPKGWGVTNIDGATSIIIDHRGKTPKKMGADWAESGYPAISAKNIKGGKIVRSDTIRFVDDELYKKWMKSPLQPGDIALTSEAPMGELFYFANKHDYLLSQRLYGLRADPQICSGSFLYFWLRTEGAWSDMEGRSTGTTVLGIRQSELRKVAVLKSDKNIIGEFSEIAESYLKQIEGNSLQVRNLESLRDTLLPKLISGELRIPDAQ